MSELTDVVDNLTAELERWRTGLNIDGVRRMLASECEVAGGQSAWARAHDVSSAYVSDVLSGRRDPGESVLTALGLERVVRYHVKVSCRTTPEASDDGQVIKAAQSEEKAT